MIKFIWHWLFHHMRMNYEHVAQDVESYYLCKCGAAFVIKRGWRPDRKWFTDIEPGDPDEIRDTIEAIRQDVQSL